MTPVSAATVSYTHLDVYKRQDIRFGQRRGVVDAVAGHRHDASLTLQAFDQRQFVGGLDLAVHFVDAQAGADRPGGGQAVACLLYTSRCV